MNEVERKPGSTTKRVSEIAEIIGGSVIGDSGTLIDGLADIPDARAGDLVFAESARFLAQALISPASAILLSPDLVPAAQTDRCLIVVDRPRIGFLKALESFVPIHPRLGEIHPDAKIDATARIGADVSIGPTACIEADTVIGDRVVLMPGVYVGRGCVIGDETILYPNVTLYPDVVIGRRCRLHAGSVIGADGFGYIPVGYTLRKVPHIGSVHIGDDVEIGANSCVDRAKTGITQVGAGTKIDNLVHIAHNVKIGQSCLIIAQAGIAGSVEIGNGVVLAGQAGVADHIKIGDGARVGAQGGVIGDVPPGETVSGYPARPHRQKMREHAAGAALPEYIRRIRALEKRLGELETQAGRRNDR